MSIYLFIQLPKEAITTPELCLNWLRWDSKKEAIQDSGKTLVSSLADIAALDAESTNILIVPGEDIRALSVSLPNKSKAAFNTIPYQLEESLSSKIEDLHIVSGKIENGLVTSFVTEHSLMQQWLQFIEQTKVKFRWLVADFSLLPTLDNLGSAWSDGSRFLVRSDQFQGALCKLAFSRCHQDYWPDTTEQLNFYTATDFIAQFPKTATRVNTDLLPLLAKNFVEQPPNNSINLLQGPYQQSSHNSKKLKQFIAPAIIAVLIIISFIALAVTNNFQLKQQDQQLKQQMTSLYKSLFPKDRRIKDPYAQMRGKLKQTQGTEQHQFLQWMALVAPILEQHKISLVNLIYDKSPLALRLQVEAVDYNALENVALTINQSARGDFLANLGTLQKSSLNNTITSILTLKVK